MKNIKEIVVYFLIFFAVSMVMLPVFDYVWSLITNSAFELSIPRLVSESGSFAFFFTLIDVILNTKKK